MSERIIIAIAVVGSASQSRANRQAQLILAPTARSQPAAA
jgi:hypothetical protein